MEWVKRLCAAKDLLEWQKLSAELHASSSNEEFRWRILCACLKHFVELETKCFERQVYEYCLAVFRMFEPDLSAARERELEEEVGKRACVVSSRCSLEFGSMCASERELIELVKTEKISANELIRRISDIKTSRTWAVLNFFLYSALYARKYGKIPGGAFAIPIGFAVGALGRCCMCKHTTAL